MRLQLLHLGLPSKSLKVYENAEYSYATFLNNDTSTEISVPMKLAAIEFACGNQPKWAIVAEGRKGSVNYISKQEPRFTKVISDMRDIWTRATEKSNMNEWLYIVYLLHNSREGATTLMMQLGWEHFFVTLGAAVLHMKDNHSKDFNNLEDDLMLLLRITNPNVPSAKKTPIILLADRTISDLRIKQVIDVVMKHNMLCPKDIMPLFIIRLSFAVSRTTTLSSYPCKYTDTKTIPPPSTGRDLVEIDECVGNILQILRPELSTEKIKRTVQKLKESNSIRDEPRFSYLRGMILFKTLGNKDIQAKFKADIDAWIQKQTIKVYEKAENSPALRSLLHTLCYVALAQFSIDNFTGVPTRLLLNFLNDPKEMEWMFSNYKFAEEYLLKRAHNNLFGTCLHYLRKGNLTAGYSLFPFPLYPTSAATDNKVGADAKLSSEPDKDFLDSIELEDILLYRNGNQVSKRGEVKLKDVPPVSIGASDFNDFEDKAKKLLFLDGDENFWYEALILDKSCLKFNAVFLEPFLRCALLQEAFKDQSLASVSPLRDPEIHYHRFYYCIIKLLFSIVRDETSMISLKTCLSQNRAHVAPPEANQTSSQTEQISEPSKKKASSPVDKEFFRSLAYLAIKILTSRQIEIIKLPNSTNHNMKKFSKAIGEVVGGYALSNTSNLRDIFDCDHKHANAIMLFFIAQSVYHNFYTLSTVTVRFIHLLLNASAESIKEDEQKAKDIQRVGEILFAVAASHCYNAFYCDQSIGMKVQKAGALVLLGNTGRYLIRLTSRVFVTNLLSIISRQQQVINGGDVEEGELLEWFFSSLRKLLSLANMAKYWYEISLLVNYDQSYAVSDEAHMWIELMEYFVKPVFDKVTEPVKKKLRAALFDVPSRVQYDNESTGKINEYLNSWQAFYSYQDIHPTNEISVSRTFKAEDFRVFTMSDVLSVLASKSLELSTMLLQSNLDPTYAISDSTYYEDDGYESNTNTALQLYNSIQVKQKQIVQFVTDSSYVSSHRDALLYYLDLYEKIKSDESTGKTEKDVWLNQYCVDIVSSAMRCWYCSSEDNKLGTVDTSDVKRVLDAILYCMEMLKYEERMMKIYIEMSPYSEQLMSVDHVIEKLHQWSEVASDKNKLLVKRYQSICHFHRVWGEFAGKRELNLNEEQLMKVDRLDVAISSEYTNSVEKIRELNGYYDSLWITGTLKTDYQNIFMVGSKNESSQRSDDLIFVYPAQPDLTYIPLTVKYRRRLKNDSAISGQQMQLFGKVISMDFFEGRQRGVVALIGGFQGVHLPFGNKVAGTTTDSTDDPVLNSFCSLCVSFWSRGISAIDVKSVDEETVRRYILHPSSYRPKICWASIVDEGLCGIDFINTAQNLTDLADSKKKEFLIFLEKFKFARSGENKLFQSRISELHFATNTGIRIRVAARRAPVAYDYHLKTLFGPCEVTFSVCWLFAKYLSVWLFENPTTWDNSGVSPEKPDDTNQIENLNSFNGLMAVLDNEKRRLVAAKEGIVVVRKNKIALKSADIGILFFSPHVPKSDVVRYLEQIYNLALRTRVQNPYPVSSLDQKRARSYSSDSLGAEEERVVEPNPHVVGSDYALWQSKKSSAETTSDGGSAVGCYKYTPAEWAAVTSNTDTETRRVHSNTDVNGACSNAVTSTSYIEEFPALSASSTTNQQARTSARISSKPPPISTRQVTGANSNNQQAKMLRENLQSEAIAVGGPVGGCGKNSEQLAAVTSNTKTETRREHCAGSDAVGCNLYTETFPALTASADSQQILPSHSRISSKPPPFISPAQVTATTSQQPPVVITSILKEKLVTTKLSVITASLNKGTVDLYLTFLSGFNFVGGSSEFQSRITEFLKGSKRIYLRNNNAPRNGSDYHVKTITGATACSFSIAWFYFKYVSLWIDNDNNEWDMSAVKPTKVAAANSEEKRNSSDGLMVIFDNKAQKLVAVKEGILVLRDNKDDALSKLADIGIIYFSNDTPSSSINSCLEKIYDLAKRTAPPAVAPVSKGKPKSSTAAIGNSSSVSVTSNHSVSSVPSMSSTKSKAPPQKPKSTVSKSNAYAALVDDD